MSDWTSACVRSDRRVRCPARTSQAMLAICRAVGRQNAVMCYPRSMRMALTFAVLWVAGLACSSDRRRAIDTLTVDARSTTQDATVSDWLPERAAVASYYPIAARVGIQTIAAGGTAADAFIATSMAEWVLAPGITTVAGNLGALVYDTRTGEVWHLDGEYNNVSDPDGLYTRGDPTGKTVAVFGSVAALGALHERHGALPWSALLQPAIELARDGFVVSDSYAATVRTRLPILTRTAYGRRTYTPAGSTISQGSTLRLPELATFLTALATQGPAYMYTGAWANECVAAVQAKGGRLTASDLAQYEPLWHKPHVTEYRGHRVLSSAGRFYGGLHALVALEVLEHGTLDSTVHYSKRGRDLATLTLVARTGWSETWLRNPAHLDDRQYIVQRLTPAITRPLWEAVISRHPAPVTFQAAPSHSTSLGIVDDTGLVIIGTHSINAFPWAEGIFVQGVVLTGGGGHVNQAGAGERRTSPLSHHMVFRNGQLTLASSSWDSSIIEAGLQYLVNAMDYQLPAADVVSRPRFGIFPWNFATGEIDASSNWLDSRVTAEVVSAAEASGLNFVQTGYVDTGRGTVISFQKDGQLEAANATRHNETSVGSVEYGPSRTQGDAL